jgi:hypothetical protein
MRNVTVFSSDSGVVSESSVKTKAPFNKLHSVRNGYSNSTAVAAKTKTQQQPLLKQQLDDEMAEYWARAKK